VTCGAPVPEPFFGILTLLMSVSTVPPPSEHKR
jgi:hypothetical protein